MDIQNVKKNIGNLFLKNKGDGNNKNLNKGNNVFLKPKHYYHDLINPYQLLFHPSFLEVNQGKLKDYMVLNDMSGEKSLNYLEPIIKNNKKSDLSLHFSPIDGTEILKKYVKERNRLQDLKEKDISNGIEPDKKMLKMLEDYNSTIADLEDDRDSFLNYSIVYSQDIEKKQDINETYQNFMENRTSLYRFFSKNVQQPSKFYTPLGQIEEAYLSQQPLCEYRLKDWSNIGAVDGSILYPFFTETKDPSAEDGVPYGVNRNTGELLFFNHPKLYREGYITNMNLNVFGGTGSGKTSFLRSQIPLRIPLGDHFILFDPKKDYVAFTKDMGGQTISFRMDEPLGYNFFYREDGTYIKREKIDGKFIEKEMEIQSIEDKKQNLFKIFSLMCPFLDNKSDDQTISDFAKGILDSALSKIYVDNPTGDGMSLQYFYDKYLNDTIKAFVEKEPAKMNGYTVAGERLKTTLGLFITSEDGTKGMYHKMFLPVPKEKEIKLGDSPIINFDLSGIFKKSEQLFVIGTIIGMEFAWTQIAKKKWIDESIFICIDENWALLKQEKAGDYEESFSRLIRGLGGGLITMSQHLNEYVNTTYGNQVLAQAQTNIILKIEPNELEHLKKRFPKWFTDEVIADFEEINRNKDSYGIGYISYRGRMQPFKYLYLKSTDTRDSWQEKNAWRRNLDSEEGFEVS